jgi:hypothetical protein
MGALASESEFRGPQAEPPVGSKSETTDTLLDAIQLRHLAQSIVDKEPSEIRALVRNDPDLVRGWIAVFKARQLKADHEAELWGSALDHIRLCTLSPLKFAAE